MKIINKLFLLPIALISLVSCGGGSSSTSSSSETPSGEIYKAICNMEPSLEDDKPDYHIEFTLDSNMFNIKSSEFSKDIAMFAFGCAANKEKAFYEALKFDDIVFNNPAHTKDTITYFLVHHNLNGRDFVEVSIGGTKYKKEWENNMQIGLSGNHEGFEARATDIYTALKPYIAKYSDPKLLITGYSRAGGIANILAHQIMSQNDITINKDDMYVYTFEAPKSLLKEGKIEYENVFNIINSQDLIPYISPEDQYGFARYGKDIDIYNDNLKELVQAFDSTIEIPDFASDTSSTPSYTNQVEFINYFISIITEQEPETPPYEGSIYIPTRSDYATKLQKPLQTMFDIYYSLPKTVVNKLVEDVKAKGYLYIATLMTTEGEIYNFLKPYLEEAEYQYDEEDLKADLESIRLFICGKLTLVVSVLLTNPGIKDNLIRSVYLHYPEVNYPLLSAYTPSNS